MTASHLECEQVDGKIYSCIYQSFIQDALYILWLLMILSLQKDLSFKDLRFRITELIWTALS